MKTPKLAQNNRKKTIADGATFMCSGPGVEPVTFDISGEDMKKPVEIRVNEPGVAIQRVSTKYDYITYQLTTKNAKDMGYKVIWVLSWLKEKGYEHIKWVNQGPRESVGYAQKVQPAKEDR